jgi:hypothetical protein
MEKGRSLHGLPFMSLYSLYVCTIALRDLARVVVSAVEQIERELDNLKQAIADLAEEFHVTYGNYLNAIGQAVRQQLIMATYQVCTRGYPGHFLCLTGKEQQQLRQTAKQLEADLLAALQPVVPVDFSKTKMAEDLARSIAAHLAQMTSELTSREDPEPPDLSPHLPEGLDAEDLAKLGLPGDESETGDSLDSPEPDANQLFAAIFQGKVRSVDGDEDEKREENWNENSGDELENEEDQDELEDEDEDEEDEDEFDESRSLIPKDLEYWQESLEEKIAHQLQETSHRINRMLQEAGILPRRLPQPMVEMSARADAESTTPNLLTLTIEPPKGGQPIQVMAVRLRLLEIEFADPVALMARSQIRKLLSQLTKLKRDYQNKQRQRSVAQAEAAWRSNWYED